jgi:hypothetical protein
MPVVLTQEVEGHNVGDTYTGTSEAWLLAMGYADQAGYDANTSAVLTGGSNAVNIVTGGALVFQVRDDVVSVTLADGDTPAAAATKIDTALAGKADAAITGGKLVVTSVDTGYDVSMKVVSGAGTTLANLGLTADTLVRGSDGGPGVSGTGPAGVAVASDPLSNTTRGPIATDGGTPEAATNDGVTTKAYPAPTKHYVGPLA